MNLRTAKYMIDEMMTNLGRRKGGNTIAVIIMGLSLLILVVFLMVTLNMASLIDKTSEEMRLFVYLEDGLDQEVTQDIQLKLLGFRGIEEVSFISKDEALIEFREMLGEESDLLDELVENPLPDAFRVKPKQGYITSEFLASIAAATEKWEGVEEVRYGKKWFERGETAREGDIHNRPRLRPDHIPLRDIRHIQYRKADRAAQAHDDRCDEARRRDERLHTHSLHPRGRPPGDGSFAHCDRAPRCDLYALVEIPPRACIHEVRRSRRIRVLLRLARRGRKLFGDAPVPQALTGGLRHDGQASHIDIHTCRADGLSGVVPGEGPR